MTQAAILEAEGKRQSIFLEAEGYALALHSINNVAASVDSTIVSVQYREALRDLGASPATKLVIPTEFTNLLRPFMEHTTMGRIEMRTAALGERMLPVTRGTKGTVTIYASTFLCSEKSPHHTDCCWFDNRVR